jgi:hypothetical protein
MLSTGYGAGSIRRHVSVLGRYASTIGPLDASGSSRMSSEPVHTLAGKRDLIGAAGNIRHTAGPTDWVALAELESLPDVLGDPVGVPP